MSWMCLPELHSDFMICRCNGFSSMELVFLWKGNLFENYIYYETKKFNLPFNSFKSLGYHNKFKIAWIVFIFKLSMIHCLLKMIGSFTSHFCWLHISIAISDMWWYIQVQGSNVYYQDLLIAKFMLTKTSYSDSLVIQADCFK